MNTQAQPAIKTALYDLHVSQGGRMVSFADYLLPVQFEGIVAEHLHTRASAGLFDVSHMGQLTVIGPNFKSVATSLEKVLPADLRSLAPGQMRYSLLLNERGTIEDDLIVTRPESGQASDGTLFVVVNAARKHHDIAFLQSKLGGECEIVMHEDRALLALQGPLAASVLAQHCDAASQLVFMQSTPTNIAGISCIVSRSGYTGEDGFELSVANKDAKKLAQVLFTDARVRPIGLGARDSLRLEAGLCLYGHDMDDQIDPISAGLLFAIGKNRREQGGFLGADKVLAIRQQGAPNKRVGIQFEGRAPVREGSTIVDQSGAQIGRVTSGSYSPSLELPIAMGYVPKELAKIGTKITAIVRGKSVVGEIVKMPFVPAKYVRLASDPNSSN